MVSWKYLLSFFELIYCIRNIYFKVPACFLICFSNALPKGEKVNLAFYIALFWYSGSVYSPIRYSYLYVLFDINADIFTAFLLMSHSSSLSLVLSSILIISFYILSRRLFLNRKRLPDARFDARVTWITKNEFGFAVHFFVKIHKALEFNIWWMIKWSSLCS